MLLFTGLGILLVVANFMSMGTLGFQVEERVARGRLSDKWEFLGWAVATIIPAIIPIFIPPPEVGWLARGIAIAINAVVGFVSYLIGAMMASEPFECQP